MTAQELFEEQHKESWNWENEWFPVLSANEWVLGCDDGKTQIPMRYALQLLIDHFGADHLHRLIEMARRGDGLAG